MYVLPAVIDSLGGLELSQANCCSFSCQTAIAKRQPQARSEQALYWLKYKTYF